MICATDRADRLIRAGVIGAPVGVEQRREPLAARLRRDHLEQL
jgi:hypothetical protein